MINAPQSNTVGVEDGQEFFEVFEHPLNEIERMRPVRMPRELNALEGCLRLRFFG